MTLNVVTALILRFFADFDFFAGQIRRSGCIYSVSQKSGPPPITFCNIFTQVENISMKFLQYVASLYLHIFTNFGRLILIFNKMALHFLGEPIVFNVFRFKFHQVRSQ